MAAGIVTVDETVFADLVSGYPSAVRQLALGARSLIYAVLPETVEVVWPRQGTVGYSTGPKKVSEQFCWLAAAPAHLVFGFYYFRSAESRYGLA